MRQNSTTSAQRPAQRKTQQASRGVCPTREEIWKRINPNAAGIDIGSTEHYVAVPPDRSEQPVRHFGCLTADLHQMAQWLKECGVDTVAMESTGVYWVPVAQVLESYGLVVVLVDAAHVKNVAGRKTDVCDCQWLQQLHTFGLLRGAFRPAQEIAVLRSYWRHRAGLVEACAHEIHLMHKALEQMNIQLHKVLSDVTGVTGMAIIRAILAGERDGAVLAKLRQASVKNNEETFVKALTGDWRAEHLYTLKDAVELYDIFQQKIAACDAQVQEHLKGIESKADPQSLKPSRKGKAKRRKNQAHFDLRQEAYRISGVDLSQMDGIDSLTVFTLLSECGPNFVNDFPTEGHFSSWLGLCPNNRITGGKVRRHRTRKVQNRVAKALRVAAQSLHASKSSLGAFYRRMKLRLDAPGAITAAANKLARLIYRLVKFGHDYVDQGEAQYQKRYQEQQLHLLKKRAKKFGYQLVSTETGELLTT